jgi:type 1 fimbria pilin
MNRFTRILLLTWVAVAIGAGALHAQDSQVSGQILDTSNSVVSEANVTLTRVETGEHREVASSTEGYYSFPSYFPAITN